MSQIPVVEFRHPNVSPRAERRAEEMAAKLQQEYPELELDESLEKLMCERLEDLPTLHLDDLGGIPLLDASRVISFQQERARLRAGDGDLVAACGVTEGYEDYCRDRLQLGSVQWYVPDDPQDSHQISAACWQDEVLRKSLLKNVRHGNLRYVHPHLGTDAVWEFAGLLSQYGGRKVKVIGPPPALTEWVNNKLSIAELAHRMFGPGAVPRTMRAANLAKAAEIARDLIEEASVITLKLPSSVGGGGNLTLEAATCRGKSLAEIHAQLQGMFEGQNWEGECELLIGVWETNVLRSPSAQLWIPPQTDGPPIVEALFEQDFGEVSGVFVGARPADLDDELAQQITNESWLLARVFQLCGYVGRCSFDTLLVGEDEASGRLEFLECNGRWGAASLPMTLMNRLFGDWRRQPFAVRDIKVEGLNRLSFRELTDALCDELYDARSGKGSLILINPARMRARSSITAMAIANSWQEASRVLTQRLPEWLREIVSSAVPQ